MKVSIVLSLYRVERYLEKYFEDALNQRGLSDIEFSIVHNDPTEKEKEIIEKYNDRLNIVYQEVKLESLYASWNRAILTAFTVMPSISDMFWDDMGSPVSMRHIRTCRWLSARLSLSSSSDPTWLPRLLFVHRV